MTKKIKHLFLINFSLNYKRNLLLIDKDFNIWNKQLLCLVTKQERHFHWASTITLRVLNVLAMSQNRK